MTKWTQSLSSATVHARDLWNEIGYVEEGKGYAVIANGQWTDGTIKCGPEGYHRAWLKPFEWLRRIPEQNWFVLVGVVDRNMKTAIAIGQGTTFVPSRSGILFGFANDVRAMYWNNGGAVEVHLMLVN